MGEYVFEQNLQLTKSTTVFSQNTVRQVYVWMQGRFVVWQSPVDVVSIISYCIFMRVLYEAVRIHF